MSKVPYFMQGFEQMKPFLEENAKTLEQKCLIPAKRIGQYKDNVLSILL